MNVRLNLIKDIKTFIEIASKYPFDIIVSSGNYKVNAKSILGIMSLDLGSPVNVSTKAGCDDKDFFDEIKRFAV